MSAFSSRKLLDAGAVHLRAGRLAEAADAYRRVLASEPDNAVALANLGTVALYARHPQDALGLLQRAARLRPDVASIRSQLAAALRALNRWEESLEQCRQAAALQPASADFVCDIGTTLGAMGRDDESAAEYRKAIALDSSHVMGHYNLGVVLQKQKRFAEAAEALRRATRLNPDFALAHNNLGSVLRDSGDLETALASYRRAMALQPNDRRYPSNLAVALQDLGRLDEALASFDASLRLRPDYAKARAFRSLALLLTGDYERGFADYESRREAEGPVPDRSAGRPLWDGSDPSGKTILLHSEQGLGDTIHFVRYAPLLAARGARVIVQCQPPLKSLLEASLPRRGVLRVIADGESSGEFDVYCPLPGLPLRFGTRLETIPGDVPYLWAPPDRVEAWRRRIHEADAGRGDRHFRVGIVWAGAPGNRNDRRRSVPLAMFEPLARVPGVRLYSLQKGDSAAADMAAKPAGMAIEDLGAHFADFSDTAGVVANLDLVVCVDTSVAHLAGAMAKPVWTLIPFAPDWRWMLGRTDSPWYPTLRLFRQPTPGDWGSAFSALEAALRNEVKQARDENTAAESPGTRS